MRLRPTVCHACVVGPLGARRCVVVRGRAALGGRGGGGCLLHLVEPVAFLWDREAGWIFLTLGRVLRGGACAAVHLGSCLHLAHTVCWM